MGFFARLIVLVAASSPLAAQLPTRGEPRHFQAEVTATQIVVSQGQDESFQRVAVDIWGRLRDPDRFRTLSAQLDGDPELEFLVISRNQGTGPYYRLQIVASRQDGILVWSYASCGMPRVETGRIALGECAAGLGSAETVPTFRSYRLTDSGLVAE